MSSFNNVYEIFARSKSHFEERNILKRKQIYTKRNIARHACIRRWSFHLPCHFFKVLGTMESWHFVYLLGILPVIAQLGYAPWMPKSPRCVLYCCTVGLKIKYALSHIIDSSCFRCITFQSAVYREK